MESFGSLSIDASEVKTEYSDISRGWFPKEFIFGVGTSAYQHEGGAARGGRGPCGWDIYTMKTPGRIADGSNGNVAVDMYSKYKEDIQAMKSMGVEAYRFSISWSRILPGGRACAGVNKEAINYYNDLINTLLDNGIEPYVTLFHFDIPYCLEHEYGGFLNKDRIVTDFRDYAELCFWEFGDRVKNWITINEPTSYAILGYVNRVFPTVVNQDRSSYSDRIFHLHASTKGGKRNLWGYRDGHQPDLEEAPFKQQLMASYGDSPWKWNPSKDPYTVGRNMLVAHAEAVHSYRTKFQGHQQGKIGITLVSHWFYPFNEKDPKDVEAAKRAVDFMLGWFLEPVITGSYPKRMTDYVDRENLASFNGNEVALLKGSIDFLGLNYYTAYYAENDPNDPKVPKGYAKDQQVAFYTERNGRPIGKQAGSSWLYIVPDGIYQLLKHANNILKKSPNCRIPPIYITENGVDEKNDFKLTAKEACNDRIRIRYHQDHLGNILKAMTTDKVNVKGYFIWSWIDNFEWVEGYNVRFGLIYVDYKNDLTRYPKRSAVWFATNLGKKQLHSQN